MDLILLNQATYLSLGRRSRRRRVSNSQPRVVLSSERAPSANSFLIQAIASLGMGSTVANGRATIWIEKRVAARAFANISGQSKDKVGVSSMYTSALAQQSMGGGDYGRKISRDRDVIR